MLVALVLRSIDLGSTNLWLDEAHSWQSATYPISMMFGHIEAVPGSAYHVPLYFALLKGWMALFGDSEAALRSLSVLVSVALIAVTYAIGVRLLTRGAALVGTLLVALSPMQLYFAQEVRMYMLAALTTACCALAYLAWLDRLAAGRRTAPLLAAYALFAALTLYTHYASAFFLAALNLDALLRFIRSAGIRIDRAPGFRPWAAAHLVAVLAFLPFFLTVDRAAAEHLQDWRAALSLATTTREFLLFFLQFVHGLYYYAHDLFGAAREFWLVREWGGAARRFLELAVVFPLTLLALVWVLAHPPRTRSPRLDRLGSRALPGARHTPGRFLLLCLLLPLAFGALISLRQELDLPRYFLYVTPYLALLLGAGLTRMPRPVAAVALAVLLGSMELGIIRYWTATSRDSDYRPVARWLVTEAEPGEAVLALPADNEVSLHYYLRNSGLQSRALEGEGPVTERLQSMRQRLQPVRRTAGTPDGSRTWLVIDYRSDLYSASPARLVRELGAQPLQQRRFGAGAGVLVVALGSTAPPDGGGLTARSPSTGASPRSPRG